eukprot:TRINITY_DN20706_c2_g1_i1.p1 TRINITY_DN20706_c2_g1~~TRINITY_DN20706_c2_g1_i1.p1  ORF type:complete len:107 (+),score=2.58 TRINITY_DN20706_c2_g1_i1:333-653(+)
MKTCSATHCSSENYTRWTNHTINQFEINYIIIFTHFLLSLKFLYFSFFIFNVNFQDFHLGFKTLDTLFAFGDYNLESYFPHSEMDAIKNNGKFSFCKLVMESTIVG